ncbi:hypothetical protein L2E82_26886 [Cichorium intybus]|uniref:Uncharacterized protein n=1 Tax=Cichorium intybus TaxID=13427 RepID=A0ACB9CRC7_CICIN|nr:hypothetical protein L2E82_26886 [Cichorium intybus]
MNALLPIPFSPSPFVVKSLHAKKETKNKMVSIISGIFVFAIIFMLLQNVAYSISDAKMVMVGGVQFAEEERPLLSRQEKGTLNAVTASAGTLVNGKIIGRKMLVKMVKEEHINGEKMVSKKASSSSIATLRKGGHKVTKRSKKIDHNDHDNDHQVEVKMSSAFMALNADYHVPRSHPPKNN